MFDKVRDVLCEQLDIDPEEITMDTRFKEDLDADSLDLLELVTTLEDEYGINISEEDMEKLTTVGAVVEYLDSKGVA
ncbi:MAG TPA: acyl carrier protein [Lachnospiraceae bacterium]|nr:acyl carrier protein [Lachnospiraceae bacterium]